MNRIEIAALAAIFVLYLHQCIYWVGPGEIGYTRIKHSWKPHDPALSRLTIHGFLPVLSDPFLLRPGFLRSDAITLAPELTDYALRRGAASLKKLWVARQICRVQALLLLVAVPCLIALHLFTWIGPEFCLLALTVHGAILLALSQELPRTRRVSMFQVARPLLFNPFRAVRLMDTIAELRFRDVMRYADERGARNIT
jgi:hypothetical protein